MTFDELYLLILLAFEINPNVAVRDILSPDEQDEVNFMFKKLYDNKQFIACYSTWNSLGFVINFEDFTKEVYSLLLAN